MRLTWSTIFKILLSIALCAICIFIYRWFTKPKEGFQTTQTANTIIDISGSGTYGGINSPIATVTQTLQIPTGTTSVNSILFILSNQLAFYQKNIPVKIIATGLEVSGCRLYSYNYPYLLIRADSGNPWTATTTGVKWTATGNEIPLTTQYRFKVNFCDMDANKSDPVCQQQMVDGLVKETLVEQALYDSYEMYNFPTLPLPVTTQAVQYEMAQELTDFDVGAPIPWDYDNRVLDPKDVLWGNIHPNVSQSIFSTAYARDVLKSINNLEYDIDRGWSYTSPMFERTWSGDDQKFLPGIQVAEFIAQTAIAMAVPQIQERVVAAYLNTTSWGREAATMLDSSKKARSAEVVMYRGLVENGISKKEAKAFAQSYKNTYFENMQRMNTLSEADKALCMAEYDTSIRNAPKDSLGRVDINEVMKAHEAQFSKADEIYNRKVLESAGQTPASLGDKAAVKSAVSSAGEVVEKTAGEVVERVQKLDNRFVAAGLKSQSLTTETLRNINAATKKIMAEKTSGKLGSRLARAIGMTLDGGGLLYAIAFLVCGGQMQVCGPIVTTINIFLDIFCIACMTLIPAILEQNIPSDAVCPEGTFNIHDAMVQLPGGELGWQFITNIPGLGDGLGTFGPYICSELKADGLGTKSLGRAFLKRARVTPGYFYDSALSIYCNTNKAAMSPDNAQFSDRRKYTENDLKGDAILKYPFWKNSGVAPIWVDFSDSRLLNKMAQFYYSYARRLAADNGDGTFTFEYISKFYGVIASSEFSCDVQCEITQITYYNETGDIQTKYVVPLPSDSGTGTTYHDRRFYFYPVQVGDDTRLNPRDVSSARNIEDYYNSIIPGLAKFLNYATRNSYVTSNNDTNLNLLMDDNVRRFIVTACTNFNGTAPNTQEVDGEGNYVGDAIVSLGTEGDPYYPPQNSINSTYLAAISNAITDPIAFNPVSINIGTTLFSYNNKLIGFVVGDTIEAIPIDTPLPTDNNTILETGTLSPSAILNTSRKFTAVVTSYSTNVQAILGTITTTRQGLIFRDIVSTGIESGTYIFVIRVTARSATTLPATNDSGCSAIRSSVYRHGLPPKETREPPPPIIPSYVVTTASTDSIPWAPGAYTDNSDTNQAQSSTKMWKESLEGEVTSSSSSAYGITQSSVMGYVGFRFSYRGFPTGALLTGGILSTNFNPGWSISSLLACTYQDLMKNTGAYIINGSIIEIQIGTNNKYLFINRGPTIPFAVGYTPLIDYQIIDLQQTDCVNRIAVRKAVNAYNNLPVDNRRIGNLPSQVSKVLKIETDAQNKKCLYLFETQAIDPATNIRSSAVNNIAAIIPYRYSTPSSNSNAKVMPNLALIPNISEMRTATLNIDGSISGSLPFTRAIRSTDFSSIPPSLLSTYSTIKNININSSGTSDGGVLTTTADVRNIARTGNTLNITTYTCDYEPLKRRLMTQFNLQTNNNPRINAITSAYYPESGSKQGDGTVKCIYSTSIVTTRPNGSFDTTTVGISMSLTKANEPTNSLYDMVYNDYPTAYVYPPIPKEGQWITIPPPLPISKNILRTGCISNVDMSGCANIEIMKNLVNAFNTKVTDGKIMKVRKAYTPISTIDVCDYEVEMLRTINTTSTLIQKESIRLPIVPSPAPELCMWDLNYPRTTVTNPNTGLSLVNSASIPLLSTQYIWGQSFMTTVKTKINDAISEYLGLGMKEILSNTTMSINTEAKNIYNTLLTSISLYSPVPNCKKTCKDLTQGIINQYYIDNYPIKQYGSQKKEMIAVRRIGTYNDNTCQIEFIEKVDSYANFISSPIFTENPLSEDAQFNTRYYLRQYEFKTIPDSNVCEFDIQSIRENIVLKNAFNIIDLSGNADAIMSDASELTSNESKEFTYSGIHIDCLKPQLLNRLKRNYDGLYQLNVAGRPTQYKTLNAISTAFNPRANVCEYTAIVTHPFKSMSGSIYRVENIRVTLRAQWNSYTARSGMNYAEGSGDLQPNLVEEFDPTKIKGEIQTDYTYNFYDTAKRKLILPYTYLLPPNFNSTIVSTTKIVF